MKPPRESYGAPTPRKQKLNGSSRSATYANSISTPVSHTHTDQELQANQRQAALSIERRSWAHEARLTHRAEADPSPSPQQTAVGSARLSPLAFRLGLVRVVYRALLCRRQVSGRLRRLRQLGVLLHLSAGILSLLGVASSKLVSLFAGQHLFFDTCLYKRERSFAPKSGWGMLHFAYASEWTLASQF